MTLILYLALIFGVPTIVVGIAWFLRPDWRGRLFQRWLMVVIAGTAVLVFARLLVHSHP